MATKEDILEQVVEEYLTHLGYFVRHNIKYLPNKQHPQYVSNQDSNHSDIDVLAINPKKIGYERVLAVSCKSWQSGFDPKSKLAAIAENKKTNGREAWKGFRELTSSKWAEAFVATVEQETGSSQFTYIQAVSHVKGDRSLWEENESFKAHLKGNPIKIVTFQEMIVQISSTLTSTLAATEVGRMLQMFRASKLLVEKTN